MWPESNYDGPEWVMGLVIIIMGVMVRYHFKIKEAKEKEMNKGFWTSGRNLQKNLMIQ
jgi:uncharacterized membrane protein